MEFSLFCELCTVVWKNGVICFHLFWMWLVKYWVTPCSETPRESQPARVFPMDFGWIQGMYGRWPRLTVELKIRSEQWKTNPPKIFLNSESSLMVMYFSFLGKTRKYFLLVLWSSPHFTTLGPHIDFFRLTQESFCGNSWNSRIEWDADVPSLNNSS